MTSFGLFAFCTTLKKLNTLMANLLLVIQIIYTSTTSAGMDYERSVQTAVHVHNVQ